MEADGYTATFQDTSSAPYFLPPSVDTTSVETMLGMTLTPADMPMLVFDGLSDTLLQCPIDMGLAATGVPKQKANSNCAIQPGANGCNLCSLAWCKCDSSFTATWDGDWSPTVTPDKDVLTSATHFLYNSTLFRGLLGKGWGPSNDFKTSVLRVIVPMGAPLSGFDNHQSGESGIEGITFESGEQSSKFETWAMKIREDLEELREGDEDAGFDTLYMVQALAPEEAMDILQVDALLALVSFVFVGSYVRFHTGSAYLTACGFVHIAASFPLAFVVYRYIFQVHRRVYEVYVVFAC
jgi:hypothetical protein